MRLVLVVVFQPMVKTVLLLVQMLLQLPMVQLL